MFDKNDKALLTYRKLSIAFIIIFLIVGIIMGLILCMSGDEGSLLLGVLMIILTPFVCWLMWLINNLIISYLCDVKLIRNNLYGLDNDKLKVLYTYSAEHYEENRPLNVIKNDKACEKNKNNEQLHNLLLSGAITKEEYDFLKSSKEKNI